MSDNEHLKIIKFFYMIDLQHFNINIFYGTSIEQG